MARRSRVGGARRSGGIPASWRMASAAARGLSVKSPDGCLAARASKTFSHRRALSAGKAAWTQRTASGFFFFNRAAVAATAFSRETSRSSSSRDAGQSSNSPRRRQTTRTAWGGSRRSGAPAAWRRPLRSNLATAARASARATIGRKAPLTSGGTFSLRHWARTSASEASWPGGLWSGSQPSSISASSSWQATRALAAARRQARYSTLARCQWSCVLKASGATVGSLPSGSQGTVARIARRAASRLSNRALSVAWRRGPSGTRRASSGSEVGRAWSSSRATRKRRSASVCWRRTA